MSTEKERLVEVDKVLKEPVFIGFDGNTKVVRAQLFFISAVSLAYISMGLKISPDSSLFGIKFTNLNEGNIQAVLLVLLIYLTIHFIWLSIDAFMEWKLRITGTKNSFITAASFTHEAADHSSDPRQSTLYNFYVSQMQSSLIGLQNSIEDASNNLKNNDKDAIKMRLDDIKALINSPRVSVSLRRFDNWFKYFLVSQNLRWIVIEFSFPVGLALWAISLILMN